MRRWPVRPGWIAFDCTEVTCASYLLNLYLLDSNSSALYGFEPVFLTTKSMIAPRGYRVSAPWVNLSRATLTALSLTRTLTCVSCAGSVVRGAAAAPAARVAAAVAAGTEKTDGTTKPPCRPQRQRPGGPAAPPPAFGC